MVSPKELLTFSWTVPEGPKWMKYARYVTDLRHNTLGIQGDPGHLGISPDGLATPLIAIWWITGGSDSFLILLYYYYYYLLNI